jgi:hypothetical protein
MLGVLILFTACDPSPPLSPDMSIAIKSGDVTKVESLLKAGADVDAQDGGGDTVLIGAAMYGHVEIVKVLLQAGASVNAKNIYDNTALSLAAEHGHPELIDILKEAGARE